MEAVKESLKRSLPTAILCLLLTPSLPLYGAEKKTDIRLWLTSLEEAREAAQSSGRQIMVDLWADWCTWCRKLEENVFSTPAFQTYAEKFVLLRVDTEDGGEGTRLKERYQIDSLPTTLILSADMVKVGQLQGYLEAEPYIQSLDLERLMHYLLLQAFDEASQAGDVETLKMMADDFHDRQDGRRSAALYRMLLQEPDVDPNETAWNQYLLADSLRLGGETEAARKAQQEARSSAIEIDDPNLLELTDLLPYQIARDVSRCDEAEAALLAFLSRHPDGRYRKQAQKDLATIRKDRRCV